MAIVFKCDIPSGWIALWHITESEEQLRNMVMPEDRAACNGMLNQNRLLQRLAWRALARELLPQNTTISYDRLGAPVLNQTDGFIGVSHCKGYAAVIYNQRRCAIDIEEFTRNFDRAATRYISQSESRLNEASDSRFKAVVWCAKEALYKFSGRDGLDLLNDIHITDIKFNREQANTYACVKGYSKDSESVTLTAISFDTVCLVYI